MEAGFYNQGIKINVVFVCNVCFVLFTSGPMWANPI